MHNLQGDIVAILDNKGAAVVQYKYDAWGKPISKTGTLASTLGTVQPFRYRGYVYDEETGLYYLRSRYFAPNWCRFINADAEIIEKNLFTYCQNSPLNNSDADGTHTVEQNMDGEPNSPEADAIKGGGLGAGGHTIPKGLSKIVRNPYGKKGGPAHQSKIQSSAQNVNTSQFDLDFEVKILTPEGYKDYRYVDYAVYDKSGKIMYVVQVGRMNKNMTPVWREQKAIDDIVNAGYIVIFEPYCY